MISYFRGSFKIKLFAIVKDSRSFDVFDVFFNLCVLFFAKSQNFLSDSLPIILAINKSNFRCAVVRFCHLQTKLDSTQSYYHYLLCTQRIKSDLRSAHEIWTALILWKINLRAAKSWFDSSSSEKVNVSPSNFLAAILSSQMFFSLCAWKIMTGKNREGQLLVYDCMANASLPWLNACSHRQCLA